MLEYHFELLQSAFDEKNEANTLMVEIFLVKVIAAGII